MIPKSAQTLIETWRTGFIATADAEGRPNVSPKGTFIVVDGYQAKDRSNRANGRDVTFEDGSKIFMGSSGTGAPRDGRDPNEPPGPRNRR